MNQLIASFPDDIPLHEGDHLDLHAVLRQGVIQVTRVIRRPQQPARKKLGDWGRKWAGTISLENDRTREDMRIEFYRDKYGV